MIFSMNFYKKDGNVNLKVNYIFPSPNYMLKLTISNGYHIQIASFQKGKLPFFQYVMTTPILTHCFG